MIERASRLPVFGGTTIPVVQLEDLIGLKVQVLVNDPRRSMRDWADIRLILEMAGEKGNSVDWQLSKTIWKSFAFLQNSES